MPLKRRCTDCTKSRHSIRHSWLNQPYSSFFTAFFSLPDVNVHAYVCSQTLPSHELIARVQNEKGHQVSWHRVTSTSEWMKLENIKKFLSINIDDSYYYVCAHVFADAIYIFQRMCLCWLHCVFRYIPIHILCIYTMCFVVIWDARHHLLNLGAPIADDAHMYEPILVDCYSIWPSVPLIMQHIAHACVYILRWRWYSMMPHKISIWMQ